MGMIETPEKMLQIAKEGRPNVKYVLNDKKDAIGAWDVNQSRYVPVAGRLLTGEWVNLPVELLINNKPVERKWIET